MNWNESISFHKINSNGRKLLSFRFSSRKAVRQKVYTVLFESNIWFTENTIRFLANFTEKTKRIVYHQQVLIHNERTSLFISIQLIQLTTDHAENDVRSLWININIKWSKPYVRTESYFRFWSEYQTLPIALNWTKFYRIKSKNLFRMKELIQTHQTKFSTRQTRSLLHQLLHCFLDLLAVISANE